MPTPGPPTEASFLPVRLGMAAGEKPVILYMGRVAGSSYRLPDVRSLVMQWLLQRWPPALADADQGLGHNPVKGVVVLV